MSSKPARMIEISLLYDNIYLLIPTKQYIRQKQRFRWALLRQYTHSQNGGHNPRKWDPTANSEIEFPPILFSYKYVDSINKFWYQMWWWPIYNVIYNVIIMLVRNQCTHRGQSRSQKWPHVTSQNSNWPQIHTSTDPLQRL